MLRKIILGLVLITIIIITVACSNSNPQGNEPIKATWIEPQVVGDAVSIPLSEVQNKWNVHFNLQTQDDMNFMAYIVDGETYVRANVCPPCWSTGFALDEAVLICDRCATTFKAQTGEGIAGACVGYPKASVPYEIREGSIVMNSTDLTAAYQNTVEPGWP